MRCGQSAGGGVGEAASFGSRELALLDLPAEVSLETAVESRENLVARSETMAAAEKAVSKK